MKLTLEQQKVVEENHNLIYGFSTKRKLDLDEWYGLLAIELCKSVILYNPDKGALSTYYYMRCESLLRREYRKTQAQKRTNNGMLSIMDGVVEDEEVIEDMDEYLMLKDLLEGEHNEIILLRYQGYNQMEIAKMLGISQPQVSKILEKVREEYEKNKEDN